MNTKLLRQKILDLAIRGKLTEQKKSDGTTKDLLAQISKQWLVSSKQDSQKENASSNVIASTTSTSSRTPIRDPFAASKNSDNVIASTAKQSKKKTFAPKEIIPLDKSEAPFEIPENWEWVRLGDYLDVRDGTHDSPKYVEVGYPFVTSKNLVNGTIDFSTCKQVSKDDYDKFNERSCVEDGDILYAMIGSIGNAVLVKKDRDFAIKNVALFKKRFSQTDMNYVYYWLYFVEKTLKENAAGGLQPFISLSMFRDNSFPLPPLAEQQRIVTAIESAFAEITAIENNQELLKKHIKQGRQKILELAIRGKLTEQKESDGTTKDLLASIATASACHAELVSASPSSSAKKNSKATERSVILSKRNASKDLAKEIIPIDKDEAPFEIPENWEWVRLGDVAKVINGKNQSAVVNPKGKYPIYGSGGVMGFADDFLCPAHCTIIGRKGSINNPILVETEFWNVDTAFGMSPNELIDYKYFHYFCKSFDFTTLDSSTAMPSLTKTNVEKVRIPLPPLAEQQRIVAAIESAFTEFDAMEKI